MNEKELIFKIKKGDREAFSLLVKNHQKAVYGYLRARLFQVSDADDLTQEVFIRFYTQRGKFDSDNDVLPWLIGIARNLLREHVRKAKRFKDREVAWTQLCLELDACSPQVEGPLDEAMTHLPDCISSLGNSAQKAIDMKYSGALPLSEIGDRLKRSEGAIKLLIFRARQTLKSCLEGRIDHES